MNAGQPRWRRTFDAAERAVGRPLENVVASPRYLDVAVVGRRLKAMAGGLLSSPTTTVLHLLSLPARSDIRKLSRQIAMLTNEVRDLAADIDELRRPMPKGPASAPAPKPTRTPSASAGRESRRPNSDA